MKYVIVVDDREKIPLPIPKVLDMLSPLGRGTTKVVIDVRRMRNPTADYLAGEETEGGKWSVFTTPHVPCAAVVERKHSIEELYGNLFGPKRENFTKCLQRMAAEWRFPYLLWDAEPTALFAPSPHLPKGIDPGTVVDALMRLCYRYGVLLTVVPTSTLRKRQAAGEFVARLLLNAAIEGTPPCPPPIPRSSTV